MLRQSVGALWLKWFISELIFWRLEVRKKERKLETVAVIQFHLLLFFNGSLCCYVFQTAGGQLKPSLSNLTNKSSVFIFFHLVIFPKHHLGFALEAEKGARLKKKINHFMFPLISRSQRESRAPLGKWVHFIPRHAIKTTKWVVCDGHFWFGIDRRHVAGLCFPFFFLLFLCHSKGQAVSDRYRTCLACLHTHTHTNAHAEAATSEWPCECVGVWRDKADGHRVA